MSNLDLFLNNLAECPILSPISLLEILSFLFSFYFLILYFFIVYCDMLHLIANKDIYY